MAGNFHIEVNSASATAKLKAIPGIAKEQSRLIVTKAAMEGVKTMRMLAPVAPADGYRTGGKLKSRIGMGVPTYFPGGLGGGGVYEVPFGVQRDPRYPNPGEDPAVLVYRGTGLYGQYHRVILPRAGNFMVFFYEGRWHFTKVVKGQKPQTDWVDLAQDRANAVVADYMGKFIEDLRRSQGLIA